MITQSMTIPGDTALHAQLWSCGVGREDAITNKGVIILVHGLGDHGGRYESFAQRMTGRGWAVLAIDLPGHGLSPGRRGTAKSYETILRSIAAARETMHDELGGIDQILLGHSMGGNIAVNYVLRRNEFDADRMTPVAGLVLAAPMLMPPDFLDRSKVFAAWGTGHLFRWLRLSKPARPDQIRRDTGVAQTVENDPLQHSQISLYLATQLLAQGRFALDHAGEIDTPTLVIQGDEDELVDGAACRNLIHRMRDQGQFMSWPGGRHDLINDIDADEVAAYLAEWMDQTATKSHDTAAPQPFVVRNQSAVAELPDGFAVHSPDHIATHPGL